MAKQSKGVDPEIDERRRKRRHNDVRGDQRSAFARDRDRIIYSSAFRRLAGVTQVVAAGEGHMFHNRLTHTIKVAQIGRRLAEHLLSDESQRPLALELGINPEVVEAACLAHDLGHPPFGHVGERNSTKRSGRRPQRVMGTRGTHNPSASSRSWLFALMTRKV